MRVSIDVDAIELFSELYDEEVEAEYEARDLDEALGQQTSLMLQKIYEFYRIEGKTPDCVREYIYAKLGKIL